MSNQARIPRHEGYSDPGVVVWCRRLKPEESGYPRANKLYKEEAEKFAATQGETIADYSLSDTFTLGEQRYQVVSNWYCLDIIRRGKRAQAA